MNLADIRKKAGLVTDKPQQGGGAADGQAAGTADVAGETLTSPRVSPDGQDDILEPAGLGLSQISPDEAPLPHSSPGGNAEDDLPPPIQGDVELTRAELWQEEERPAPLQVANPVAPRPPFAAYNPLAVLLAGRVAVEDEADLAAEADEIETAADNLLEYLCFRVSDELYAVNIMEIKEIIKPRERTEVPRAPHFISGVISLRGVIIPVFDMRRRLGLSPVPASGRERIVVVRDGESFSGILVDEVVQVVRIPATSIEPAPTVLEGIDRDFVIGIGRHEGTMLILLSLENILNLSLV